jgi:hypothetical protein
VVPPSTPEEVENTIKEINNKLHYFMENPYGGPDHAERRETEDRPKQKYTNNDRHDKYEKSKYSDKGKKVIKTEDFPSLT